MKQQHSTAKSAGFSLVEIAMALGLAAFGMISLMGVLRLAIESDDSASRDTRFAAISRQVLSEMRSVPFDALWSQTPREATSASPSMDNPVDSKFYFDAEGAPIMVADGQTAADALYVCVVEKLPDEYTKNADKTMYNQLRAKLVIRWPANAPQSAQKTSIPFYANIARF